MRNVVHTILVYTCTQPENQAQKNQRMLSVCLFYFLIQKKVKE